MLAQDPGDWGGDVTVELCVLKMYTTEYIRSSVGEGEWELDVEEEDPPVRMMSCTTV